MMVKFLSVTFKDTDGYPKAWPKGLDTLAAAKINMNDQSKLRNSGVPQIWQKLELVRQITFSVCQQGVLSQIVRY